MIQTKVDSAFCSLETYLNPVVFRKRDTLRKMNCALVAGRPVVVRNALQEAFAERMFQCLDRIVSWERHEYFGEFFHYCHHNLLSQEENLPPELVWCYSVFSGESTKRFMGELAERDCSGKLVFSVSRYLPGDYANPHNDKSPDSPTEQFRQLAYVWHLSKNWQPQWGGHFHWSSSCTYIAPSFNTLILFTIDEYSTHSITHVTPYAQTKRLTINGWFTSKDRHAGEDGVAGPSADGEPPNRWGRTVEFL